MFDLIFGPVTHCPVMPLISERVAYSWPYYVGGYEGWSRNHSPYANVYSLLQEVDELREATMLEF